MISPTNQTELPLEELTPEQIEELARKAHEEEMDATELYGDGLHQIEFEEEGEDTITPPDCVFDSGKYDHL